MSHGLTEADNVVLHKNKAWHNLGIVVEDAPEPYEAARMAGLDWEVRQTIGVQGLIPGEAGEDPTRFSTDSHVLNIRSDTGTVLGVVGQGYVPVQNAELADFCYEIADASKAAVKVESAGSIWGGKKLWFLLKGESFELGQKGSDEVIPYVLVANGHDGGMGFRVQPTTIRVVCSNTLHAVVGKESSDRNMKIGPGGISFKHVGDMAGKVEQAKAALAKYDAALKDTKGIMGTLAAKDVRQEDIREFWLDVYQRQFGAIPVNPKNSKQEKQRERATEAFARMGTRFDREAGDFGASAWIAVNAYTGWLQHDRKVRAKDDDARADAKASTLLTGTAADRTSEAFKLAVQRV